MLLRQGRNVEAGQAFHKAVAKGEEVLVSALDLVCLHRSRVDAIDHEHKMVAIFDIADHIKVPCKLITMQISTDRDKLALPDVLGFFKQSAGVLFALLLELFVFGVALSSGHRVRAIALLRLGKQVDGLVAGDCHGSGGVRLPTITHRIAHPLHLLLQIVELKLGLDRPIQMQKQVEDGNRNTTRNILRCGDWGSRIFKETHVIGLIHKLCLIVLDNGHVFK